MALATISASDLERFGYCPLSWWLSLEGEVSSKELEQGEREHSEMSRDISNIMENERRALTWERMVVAFSLVATVLGVLGISLLAYTNAEQLSMVMGLLSIVWIVAALYLLFRSATAKDEKERARARRIVLAFAIVAMVIALNAVTVLNVNPEMAFSLEIIALIWLIAASLALYQSLRSERLARELRLKREVEGEIGYVDRGGSRLLRSERYGLQGRPDYILRKEGEAVPVELKTGRTPRGPLFSHILQVAAYCLLLEEEGEKVSHGLLRYEEAEHEVEFNQDLRQLVLGKLEEMRSLRASGNVHRNHNRPGKCRSCSRRERCPERLS